jgi:hypothetical protein
MKTLRPLVAFLLPVTLLVGCGTSKVWYQEGKSFQDTSRDLAACRAEAARLQNPLAAVNLRFLLANDANTKNFIKNCMLANGYSLVHTNSLPAGVKGVPK